MAKGRMIVKSFSYDDRIWDISERGALYFAAALPHVESDGSLPRNAEQLRCMCFPKAKITRGDVEGIILEWLNAKTEDLPPICREDGKKLIFTDFEECNENLHFSRDRVKKWRMKRVKQDVTLRNVTNVSNASNAGREVKRSEEKEKKQHTTTLASTANSSGVKPEYEPNTVRSKRAFEALAKCSRVRLSDTSVLGVWDVAFPDVDLAGEILKADAWGVSTSKTRSPRGWTRTLNGWFTRAQDKAKGGQNGAARTNPDLVARG